MITNKNPVVAVFESHDQVENAIRQLQNDGFDLTELSIVGKDHFPEEHVAGYFTAAGNRMLDWGKLVACWGSFWVPGVGRLFVAGPFVLWITDALRAAGCGGKGQRPRCSPFEHRHSEEQCHSIRGQGEERQTAPGSPRNG